MILLKYGDLIIDERNNCIAKLEINPLLNQTTREKVELAFAEALGLYNTKDTKNIIKL